MIREEVVRIMLVGRCTKTPFYGQTKLTNNCAVCFSYIRTTADVSVRSWSKKYMHVFVSTHENTIYHRLLLAVDIASSAARCQQHQTSLLATLFHTTYNIMIITIIWYFFDTRPCYLYIHIYVIVNLVIGNKNGIFIDSFRVKWVWRKAANQILGFLRWLRSVCCVYEHSRPAWRHFI